MKKIDLIGLKFGNITVVDKSESKRKPSGALVSFWICKCDCGIEKIINGESLRDGRVKSCGCIRNKRIGNLNRSHSMSNTKEYKSWQHIKYRCLNKNSEKYSDYGGRGITVCYKWVSSFEDFIKDMGFAPTEKHTIDRINVNGNYEKSNCRWADNKTQSNNQRRTIRYDYKGDKLTLSEIAEKENIPYKYFWKLFKTEKLSFDEIIERNKKRLVE